MFIQLFKLIYKFCLYLCLYLHFFRCINFINVCFVLFSIVTDPPEITLKPRNQQVKANGIAAFYCAARGDPTPQIQWRKNGKRLSGTQSRYLVQDFPQGGALLRIDPVRANRDDATYECLAENGVGDAVTAEAVLTVYEGNKSTILLYYT